MSSTYTGSGSQAQRITEFGYGMNDITLARQGLQRQSALQRFQLGRQYDKAAKDLTRNLNQRGMLDSGVAKRQREEQAGDKQLASYNLESQIMEAQAQLDRQQLMIEEQFSAGSIDQAIADAVRRFTLAQTMRGLTGAT